MITTSLLALSLIANPRPFPFSYTYPTVAPGHLEVEQYVDIIPIRVERELADGTVEGVIRPRFQLQTELELGITDKLELGLYLVFEQGPGDSPLRFRGVKQRVRYRLFEQGELPSTSRSTARLQSTMTSSSSSRRSYSRVASDR
jgi:hypothetical protein